MMLFMKKIFTLLSFFLLTYSCYAQNFNYGTIDQTDINFDRNKIDSNANAVVLQEYGTTRLQIDDATGNLVLQHDYHVKIKIFNKEGFNQANVIIPLYKDDNQYELISEIKATTYNAIDGVLHETLMDKKAIFNENRSKYTTLTKFTLPNIKENSIIEYSYHIQSPLLFNFKQWDFQSDIPKVASEYVAYIPANYNYNVLLRGFYKLSDQKSEISRECLRINGVNIDCSKMTYIMKNVPAFIEEDYMTAASNFKSAMYFELSDVQLLNGSKHNYTKDWKSVDLDLVSEKRLGSQMKRKDLFKEVMPTILANTNDDLSKAQAVFNYIKKQIKWNNYYGKYSEESIKNALDTRYGNVADINLSLISALSAANLDAEAVILSTRDNGTVNKIYPVITEFNYLIAKVNIGEKSYLLDASEPLLPFGLLPLRCINDQGRVINLKKPSYWIDLKAAQKSVTSYMLIGKLDNEGKIKGTLTTTSTGYSAFIKRRDIKKYNSIDEYVEKLDESLTKMSIKSHEILRIDSVEQALIEKYEVEFSVHDGTNKNQFYINPFFINRISKNPFNLNERTYPVDLGAASDERVIVNITLPANYELQDKPKDMSLGLPNAGGRYLLQSAITDNVLSLNQMLQFNKAVYSSDEYHYLKELYSKIIQNQKTDLILKLAK